MSGLCGWVCFDPDEQLDKSSTLAMISALQQDAGAKAQIEASDSCAVASVALNNKGYAYKDEYGVVAIYGFLRIHAPRLKQMVHDKGIANALLSLYEKNGAACLQQLNGHFCIALVLNHEKRALIAIDRLGVSALTYQLSGHCLRFAANSAALTPGLQAKPRINPQALFNYLYFHVVPTPQSVYQDYKRLLPGHYLELNHYKLTDEPYWKPQFEREHKKLTLSLLRDEFYTALRSSVQLECQTKPVGAFLSGGTDSSTITGIMHEFSNDPIRTYSIGFEEEGYDEMQYARLSAKHFGAKHNEYYITAKDVLEVIPRIARAYGEPFGNSSAAPTYYCAAMAKADGIKKLLAGDGGDELFAGNERYALQSLFAKYGMLPQKLRQNLIEPILLGFPHGDQVPLLKKIRSYVRQALLSMPARMETYNHLERIGLNEIFVNEFLAEVDPKQPLAMLTKTYESALCDTMLNRMLALDFKFTLADNDLPKVNTMCDMAGVDVGYPLLNDRIMQFANRLPVDLKLNKNKLRYFFKVALKDLLPVQVINKKKQGFGLPFGLWLSKHKGLNELANDSLQGLKTRKIVRAAFIDQLMGQHMRDHAAYYGSMVWILMMLEQWFVIHVDQQTQVTHAVGKK